MTSILHTTTKPMGDLQVTSSFDIQCFSSDLTQWCKCASLVDIGQETFFMTLGEFIAAQLLLTASGPSCFA